MTPTPRAKSALLWVGAVALVVIGLAGSMTSAGPAQPVRILAVFDLEVKDDLLDPSAADALADTLATWMGEGGRFRVVPRGDLRRALAKKKRASYKDCFAESCQIEIGQALAADVTLATRVVHIGRRCLVNLKIFDLRTEATLTTVSRRGGCSEDDVFDSLERAARVLTGRPEAPPRRSEPPPAPLPSAALPSNASLLAGGWVELPSGRLASEPLVSIHRTEVTVLEYRRCVEAGACDERRLNTLATCTYGRPGRDHHPVNCITWAQADRYCRWLGARLPTDAEWARAAQRGRSKYPWGPRGFSRGLRPGNVADLAARKQYDLGRRSVTYDDGFSDTAPVGTFADGASPIGALDLVGNVAEWTAQWHVEGRSRIIRGGSWRTPVDEASAESRGWLDATSREDDVGFRCVRNP